MRGVTRERLRGQGFVRFAGSPQATGNQDVDVMRLQISIDCQDPHALSRFWADALSCEVDVAPIEALVAAGVAIPEDMVELVP